MDGLTEWVNTLMDGWMNQVNGLIGGMGEYMDNQLDGWIDGWIDQMDGSMDQLNILID